ncbi:MAG: 16S rRNA (guanine(966)-N(2))-methyltransferase RsmD [Deltaproteobacteria bacterium]|jgi:16S rRNA (guanine966-N2)-methyltransferase|nr:16S rRNA (guanine(966)-N(2))-methyltransferase RsmD [Deltaproteobacteria bacterium]
MPTKIIGGEFKGLKLKTPPGKQTRPTASLVREALFNILGQSVQGRLALDLFAGSGAMGLEALSRGASSVLFCDCSPIALEVIERNLNKLPKEAKNRAKVRRLIFPAKFRLLSPEGPFDLFLLCPPYKRQDIAQEFLRFTILSNLAAPKSLVVWEMDVVDLSLLSDKQHLGPYSIKHSRCWGRRAALILEIDES